MAVMSLFRRYIVYCNLFLSLHKIETPFQFYRMNNRSIINHNRKTGSTVGRK